MAGPLTKLERRARHLELKPRVRTRMSKADLLQEDKNFCNRLRFDQSIFWLWNRPEPDVPREMRESCISCLTDIFIKEMKRQTYVRG